MVLNWPNIFLPWLAYRLDLTSRRHLVEKVCLISLTSITPHAALGQTQVLDFMTLLHEVFDERQDDPSTLRHGSADLRSFGPPDFPHSWISRV